MSYYHKCSVCGHNKPNNCFCIVALVSTMGGTKERKQQSTQSVRICDECFDKPKALRLIKTRIQAARLAIETGKPLVREKRVSPWS